MPQVFRKLIFCVFFLGVICLLPVCPTAFAESTDTVEEVKTEPAKDEVKKEEEKKLTKAEKKALRKKARKERKERLIKDLDDAYALINKDMYERSLWIDNFFGDDRLEAEGPSGFFMRWKTELSLSNKEDAQLKRRISLNFKLPKTTKKLRVVFTTEEEDRLDDFNANRSGNYHTTEDNLKLRYNFTDKLKKNFSADVNFWKIKFRYRHDFKMKNEKLFRITQTATFDHDDGFEESTELDLEKRISDKSFIRFSGGGKYIDEENKFEWGAAASYYRQGTLNEGISIDIGISGDNRAETTYNAYKIGSRYRRNFFRPWLFFEVEPEFIHSYIEDTLDHQNELKITFRIEVLFSQEKHEKL